MQTLKFLGRGDCFNPNEDNTSAYYINKNDFILIDCGETVFKKILKSKILDNNKFDNIYIVITHLHSDHVGSLSSLIFYCKYILDIMPVVIYHEEKHMMDFLMMQHCLYREHYLIQDSAYFIVKTERSRHSKTIVSQLIQSGTSATTGDMDIYYCYSYIFNLNGKIIYYSGDNTIIPEYVTAHPRISEIYQDCSTSLLQVHMDIEIYKEYVQRIKNNKGTRNPEFYVIHIDDYEKIKEACKGTGIKIVKVE